jgi:hypothetical protein
VTVELTACAICGGPPGECSDTMMAAVPLGIGGKPVGSGQWKSGRFFTTTSRVTRNGRLVYGIGTPIPWEEAAELGLVEPEAPRLPPQHALIVVEVEGGDDDGEPVTEQRVAQETVAAVKRRAKKPAGQKLRAS